jgi:hypothetical protein
VRQIDEVAIAEQESIDMLRSICAGDLTRRMMEQAKSKLTGAKPAPVNDSPTNMALGRVSKAMEALNDYAALSKAVGWCLQALGDDTMDVVKQKDKVLEEIRGWHTLCEKVTEERLTFINGTVEKELAPLKAKISKLPDIGKTLEEEKIYIAAASSDKISDLSSKAETAMVTAKKAIQEINISVATSLSVQVWQRELTPATAAVAQFGALALLHNPLISKQGAKGKALRSQLQSIQSVISGPGHLGLLGEREPLNLPAELMARIQKALTEVAWAASSGSDNAFKRLQHITTVGRSLPISWQSSIISAPIRLGSPEAVAYWDSKWAHASQGPSPQAC